MDSFTSCVATCRSGLAFAVFESIVEFQAVATRNRAFNNGTIIALDVLVAIVVPVWTSVVWGAARVVELSTESQLL